MITSGRRAKESLFDRQVLNLLIGFKNLVVCWEQAVVETLDHCHRKDDKSIFVGLISTEERICDIPDQIRFLLNINAYRLDFIVRVHILLPP